MYALFVTAPQTREHARFWRTVYGYIHSRVVSMRLVIGLSTYAETLAEELDALWLAPPDAVDPSLKALLFEEVFSPPPLPATPPAPGVGDGEEAADVTVSGPEAHDQLMHLTLKYLYVDGYSLALATKFAQHGIAFHPSHKDIAKMFLLPPSKRERILIAISSSPPNHVQTLRVAEFFLRTDDVENLESLRALPSTADHSASELSHALEVGAFKVIERVLSLPLNARARAERVDVLLAFEMSKYDLARLMLRELSEEDKAALIADLTNYSDLRIGAVQMALDSLPNTVGNAQDHSSLRDALATHALRNLFVVYERVNTQPASEFLNQWNVEFRDAVLVLLIKYNMIDRSWAHWYDKVKAFGHEAEAKANRARYAPILTARKLGAAKKRAKKRGGRR